MVNGIYPRWTQIVSTLSKKVGGFTNLYYFRHGSSVLYIIEVYSVASSTRSWRYAVAPTAVSITWSTHNLDKCTFILFCRVLRTSAETRWTWQHIKPGKLWSYMMRWFSRPTWHGRVLISDYRKMWCDWCQSIRLSHQVKWMNTHTWPFVTASRIWTFNLYLPSSRPGKDCSWKKKRWVKTFQLEELTGWSPKKKKGEKKRKRIIDHGM